MKSLFQDTTLSYAESHYEITTNRVETETALNIIRLKSSDTDKSKQPILCSFISTGKKKADFNQSNVCFVDIDTTEFTDYIINNSEEVFESLPFILAIQKSFSGKIHLICKMPLTYSLLEFSKYSISAYECVRLFLNNKFNKEVTVGYGSDGEGNHYELDLNCIKATQLLYVSNNDFIFNYNVKVDINYFNKESLFYNFESDINKYCNVNDDVFFNEISGVKKCNTVIENRTSDSNTSTTDEYNALFNTTSKIFNFQLDTDTEIKTKYLNRQLHLNYNITTSQLNDIIDNAIDLIKCNKQHYGRLLLRPHISYEGIVDVKMYFYIKKNENNETVRLKQGEHRRKHLLRWIKQIILNAIATYNHNGQYENIYKDIVYSIYWVYYECINIKGTTRDILDRTVMSLLRQVGNNWDNINVEYKTNRYIAKPDKEMKTFSDLIKYWEYLKQARYKAIEDTFSDMMITLSLQGKKFSYIAEILNSNNIEAKTKNGWNRYSVMNIMKKLNMTNECDYKNRIDELLSEGKNYSDIAEILNVDGYVTKQGKKFTKDSIKNYVRSLKK